jgi:NAD dependent epimerase/dehydratase family enzyme
MSWIHIDDLCRQFVWLVTNGHGGVFNGVAPTPVTNAEFMKELRHQLGRPWSPPAPVFGIKLVEAVAGIPSDLVLDSAKVLPKAALDNGFQFEHPTLSGALRDLLRK